MAVDNEQTSGIKSRWRRFIASEDAQLIIGKEPACTRFHVIGLQEKLVLVLLRKSDMEDGNGGSHLDRILAGNSST
jgi:hypothetical protein